MARATDRGTITRFSHHRKAEVEELLITDARLKEVEDALRQYLKLMLGRGRVRDSSHPESLYAQSLYCFAAIMYSRCFAPGRRKKLEIGGITNLTDRDRELHESVRRLRNQYFAHAVADEEGTHVFLYANPGERMPSCFSVMHVALVGDGNSTARRFLAMVAKIRKFLAKRISEAGDEMAEAFFGKSATWRKYATKGKSGT